MNVVTGGQTIVSEIEIYDGNTGFDTAIAEFLAWRDAQQFDGQNNNDQTIISDPTSDDSTTDDSTDTTDNGSPESTDGNSNEENTSSKGDDSVTDNGQVSNEPETIRNVVTKPIYV